MSLRILGAAFGVASLSVTPSLSAGESSTVRLATGEELRVGITDITSTSVTIDHPVLGSTTLPRDEVTILGLDDVQTDLPSTPAALSIFQDDAVDAPAEEEATPWKWSATLGVSYVDGNSESASVNGRLAVERETEKQRTVAFVSYFYSESNNIRSDNRTTVFGRNDWFIENSKWFIFADLGYDYDSFQSWDYRIHGHAGPGYRLVRKDNYELDLTAGLGFLREWGSSNDDWRLEGVVGFNGKWHITEKQDLVFYGNYFPDFSDTDEFRATAGAAWTLLLDAELNMSFAAGVEWEYQSEVDPGRKRNDTRVIVGLQFDW